MLTEHPGARHKDNPNLNSPGSQPGVPRDGKSDCHSDRSMKIPYENYVGAVLNQKYRITFLWTNKEHLGIYTVTSWDGVSFEAQAFELCQLPDKLYLSRKRRLRRLKQSGHCTDDFKQGQSRYLISTASSPGAHHEAADKGRPTRKPENLSAHQFPSLGPSGECDNPHAMEWAPSPHERPKTYAEAASRSPPVPDSPHNGSRSIRVDDLPNSRKGARQRERRQKRRELQRLKTACLDEEHLNEG